MGQGEDCKNFVSAAVHNHGIDVIEVGTQSPRVLDDHVLRVRTVSACVEETLALLSAKVPAASVRCVLLRFLVQLLHVLATC